MNFLEKIGKTIKSWFTGGSSKKATTSTKKKKENAVKNDVKLQRNVQNQKKKPPKKEERKTEQQKMLELQKKRTEQSKAQLNNTFNKALKPKNAGAIRDEKLKKSTQASKEKLRADIKRLKKDISTDSAQVKRFKKDINSLKADTEWTKKAQQVAGKDYQFQQKLGLNQDLKSADIRYSNEKHPYASQFLEGALDSASMGIGKLAVDRSNSLVAKTLKEVNANRTAGQTAANILGNLAGVAANVAGTAGLAEKAGMAVAGEGTRLGGVFERIAQSPKVQSIAARTGKDVADVSARIVTELQKDFGYNITAGAVMDLMNAVDSGVNKDGSLADKTVAAFESLATTAALNAGLGLATNIASPIIARGSQKFADEIVAKMRDKSGSIQIGRTLTNEEAATLRAEISNLDDTIAELEQMLPLTRDANEADEIQTALARAINKKKTYSSALEAGEVRVAKPLSETATSELRLEMPDERAELVARADAGDPEAMALITPDRRVLINDIEEFDPFATSLGRSVEPEVATVVPTPVEKAPLPEKKPTKTVAKRRPDAITKEAKEIKSRNDIMPTDEELNEINRAYDESALADARAYRQIDDTADGIRGDAEVTASQSKQAPPKKAKSEKPKPKEKSVKDMYEESKGKEEHIQKGVVTIGRKAKNKRASAKIKEDVEAGKYTVETHHNKVERARAEGWVKDNSPESMFRHFNEINNKRTKVGFSEIETNHYRALSSIEYAQKHWDEDSEAMEKLFDNALKYATDNATDAGRVMQIQAVINKMNPERRTQAVENIIANALSKKQKFVNKYNRANIQKLRKGKRDAWKYDDLIRAPYEKFKADNKDYADAIAKLKKKNLTQEEFEKLALEASEIAYKKVPASLTEKLVQWRYLAMLSSPKTDVRNVGSNMVMATVLNASDAVEKVIKNIEIKRGKLKAGDLEWSKAGGGGKAIINSHKSAKALKESGAKNGLFAKNLFDEIGIKQFSRDPKFETNIRNAVLKGDGVLNKASDIRGAFLTKEDKWSYEARYRECVEKLLNNFGDIEKVADDELTNLKYQINAIATEYAQKATYRQHNAWADAISRASGYLTDATATNAQKLAGLAVNTVMPFAKTPANVLKTIGDFMPHNLVTGKKNFGALVDEYGAALKNAKGEAAKKAVRAQYTQLINEALEQRAKGITGAGIFVLGAYLGTSISGGLQLNTNTGDDELEKYDKRQGVQDYSLIFEAPNGKKYSATLDWLSPIASVMFMGAELGKQVEQFFNGEGIDWIAAPSTIAMVASRAIEPVLDMSMLQGLKQAFESAKNTSKYNENISVMEAMGTQIAFSAMQSMIPTVMGQIKRAFADADYMLYGNTDLEYQKNLALSKLPIKTDAIGYKTDSWGELQNANKGGADIVQRLFENLIYPWNSREIKLDETDEELKRLAKETEEYDILPDISYKTTLKIGQDKNNQTELKLSGKELSEYNQAKTTGGEYVMRTALESIMFNRYKTDANGNKTPIGYTKAEKEKLIKEFTGKSAKDATNWLIRQPEYKNATDAEKISMLKSIRGATSGEAKGDKQASEKAVWKAKGKDPAEYDFKNEVSAKKQQALKDSGISYEKIVDFERNAGKTYYYEDDEGGHHQTYYNKKEMLEYIASHPELSEEEAAALFNAYKAWNAKPYGSSGGSGGWGRRKGSGKKKTTKMKKPKPPKDLLSKKITVKKSGSSGKVSKTDIDALLDQLDAKNKKLVTPPKMK